MSGLGFNKIAFCVLGTGLALIGLNEASHAAFHTTHHEKPGMFIEVPKEGEGAVEVKKGPNDYLKMMEAADVEKGRAYAQKCLQCHTFDQGKEGTVGPTLFGVVGRDIASEPGFLPKYSTGKGSLSEIEGVWDYDKLFHFLDQPKKFAPATAMNFAGINSRTTGETDRMNVIKYLRTLNAGSEFPMPAPLPPQADAPADGAAPAPADGAAPAAPGTTPAAPGATPAPAGAPPAATPPAAGQTTPATTPPAGAPAKPATPPAVAPAKPAPAPAAPH